MKDLPDPVDLPGGYRFGNYVILERIGRGGMAGVYRAEHSALSKQVAIKIMDHALHDKTAAHRQFLREGRAAAAVKHPNVVDITDVGVWQGVPFLVMEFLDGWDLETHLRERGPLSDGELVRLALPIISGLATAHDAGVIHRDLKPSNIFLAKGADGDQVPKVLDFGISKVINDAQDLSATPYGTVMGTPLYLPPEALTGAQNFSPASDQYSLGVVLYECAVGRPPHRQDTLVALLQSIGSGKFEAPSRLRPDISALVERAILRAMHSDPRQRFAHVRDLGRALWEVASPRTQVLWARTFGEGPAATSSVRSEAVGSIGSPGPGSLPPVAHASTRKLFATELTVPLSTRSKLLWGAGAALGVVCAGALTVLMRPGAVPIDEPHMSTLEQPQLELNAALRPAVVAPSSVAPPAAVAPPAVVAGPARAAAPPGAPQLGGLGTAGEARMAISPGLGAVREPQVAIEASPPSADPEPRQERRRKRSGSPPSGTAEQREPAASERGVPELQPRAEPSAPVDAVPRDAVPADAVPRDAVPRDAVPRDAVPRDAVPHDAVPHDAVPRDAVPPRRSPSGAPVGANQSPILD